MGRTRTGPPTDDDFAEFVHARWPALYRSAVMLVGDRHLAEDLVQSALASTYANWGRIERTGSAPGYARRTLHNEAFTWMRRRGWRNEVPTEEMPESAPNPSAASALADDPSLRPTAADEIDVPAPDTAAILRAGRRQHRRDTLRRVTPVVGLVAASAVAAAVLIPQSPDQLGEPEGVRVTEVAPAAFSAAETEEVTRAYVETGAFTIGTTVYLGARDTHPVELDVPAIRGLYLTSAGVLVRHGKDLSMDVASRYSLVGTDGSVRSVDLDPGDVAVGTDTEQPYFSYARKAGQGWEVVVHDLRSGELAATVEVPGDFTWGGWDAPPVSLSGDVVWVGLDEEMAAFDWRTGERVESALPGSLYPAVKGGRQLFETTNNRYETTAFQVKDARSGDVVLDIPVTARRSTLGLLSPDGKALMVGPYLMYTEDNQIRDTRGMRVVDVASGRSTTLPASPVGGYGWTPDGHVFSVDGQQAVVCDPADGECTTTELSLGVSPGDLRTLRLGGLVTDS